MAAIDILKKSIALRYKHDRSLQLISYGEFNDFPQQVMAIVSGSSTGMRCVATAAKFISGQGFTDKNLYKLVVDRDGGTMDKLLKDLTQDYATFNGFAISVSYNLAGEVAALSHVPFENVRIKADKEGKHAGKYLVYDDWARLVNARIKREDIIEVNEFNPDNILNEVEECGGMHNYKGQLYYFVGDAKMNYPIPSYYPVLTDMSTEQGLSIVSYRNARNNFLPNGMVTVVKSPMQDEEEDDAFRRDLETMQGDENSFKLLYSEVGNKDEMPIFTSFQPLNGDKMFEHTETAVSEKIGKCFYQPPILRCEDVGSSFGSEVVSKAFEFYNSMTIEERLMFERVFNEIFKYYKDPITSNFEIIPLSFGSHLSAYEKFGKEGVDKISEIINGADVPSAKAAKLKFLYGVSEEDTINLLNQLAI